MLKFKLVKTDDYNCLKSENEVNKLRIEELKEQIGKLENPESCSEGSWCKACTHGYEFHTGWGTCYGCQKKLKYKCKEFDNKKVAII